MAKQKVVGIDLETTAANFTNYNSSKFYLYLSITISFYVESEAVCGLWTNISTD